MAWRQNRRRIVLCFITLAIGATRHRIALRYQPKLRGKLKAAGSMEFAPVLDIGRRHFRDLKRPLRRSRSQNMGRAAVSIRRRWIKNHYCGSHQFETLYGLILIRDGQRPDSCGYVWYYDARILSSQFAELCAVPSTVMVNSGDVNGTPLLMHTLTDRYFKRRVGLSGVVVSDWEDIIIRLHTGIMSPNHHVLL